MGNIVNMMLLENNKTNMAKRYLTKEEKKNYKIWTKEAEAGTLLTSSDISEICKQCGNNPQKIGEHILKLVGKVNNTEFEFDVDEEILYIE